MPKIRWPERVVACWRWSRDHAPSYYRWAVNVPSRVYGVWVGRSLVRTARYAKTRLMKASAWRRRSRDAWEWFASRLQAESSAWWLFVLMFGIVWLPIPWGFRLFRSLDRTDSFLQALWQVEGATLAISLAVVIFVFQAVYASRLSGSLRQFASETFLFPIFFSGVYAIGLVGFVLLGGSYGAPQGWAASWTTLMAAAVGLSLIFLFVSTIRAIEPRALHMRRLARARREIERETERIILQRIATNFLKAFCDEHGIEFIPALSSAPSPTAFGVKPRKAGEVADVRLRLLRELGTAAQQIGGSRPRLRVYPDLAVSESVDLFWAEPQVLASVGRSSRIIRVRERTRERAFRDTIQQLHDEATRLITNPMPGAYNEILAVYEEMILALPKTWQKYGHEYAPEIAGGMSMFERDVLDYLDRDLYDEMRAAVLGSNREIAHDALHFPVGIAYEAIPLRASALTGRMFRLLVAVLDVLFRATPSDTNAVLTSTIITSLDNYGAFRVEPLITDEASSPENRAFGRVVMLQLYETISEICKRILDIDPTRTQLLGDFNGLYERFFQHWDPKHERLWRFELERAEQAGASEEEIDELRDAVKAVEAEIALHDELIDGRLVHRLGLMFWILRQLRNTGSADWVAAWPVFANYFGDVPTLARITDKAIESDFEDRSRWSNWILDTLTKGVVHGIAVDLELIDAFIVRALQLVSPDGSPPEIEPMDWTRGRLDDPAERIKTIIENTAYAQLLPTDRLEDRAVVLAEALVASNRARKEREDQKTIDAALSSAKVQEFKVGLVEGYVAERWLYGALAAAGRVVTVRAEAPQGAGSMVNTMIPKDLLTEDPQVFGGDHIAREYGVGLAHHERDTFVAELKKAAVVRPNTADPLADQLRGVVAELRGAEYEPSLILCPFSWTLTQSLELELYRGHGGDLDPPAWSGEGRRLEPVGAFDGVPVCQVPTGLDDRIVVVDLKRFASWREWVDDEGVLSVRLTSLNDVEAEEAARAQPGLFADAGDLGARTRAMRMSAWLRAESRYRIDVDDLGAAKALEIPEGLR